MINYSKGSDSNGWGVHRIIARLSVCFLLLCGAPCTAGAFVSGFGLTSLPERQDYQLSYDEPIVIELAQGGINRIEVERDRIEQVIGDMRFLRVMHDERSGAIFLTIKRANKNQQTIELTLQLNSGRHINLKCQVKRGGRRLVRIADLAQKRKANKNQSSEVKSMVQHMMLGLEGKYFVTNKKASLKNHKIPASLNQLGTYRYDNIVGYYIEVRNKSKKPLKVSSSDFGKSFAQVLAVYPKEQVLAKRGRANFIIITKQKRK